ncbi:DNA oxidative demethylase AlkB [Acetobacter conturbans]|uniref:DNA oxidative demethylase AlkB n=1 Tax=Acetobacter conturbans TaxID=1737472 RepID=A0ABX0K3L8_9PROT|nr:DNA oxidative demethylase AlkB [Acetobacter conturbans]NHN89391.1 DNA oxidative demethylase AlkB [Acetobacter conturbans]
MTADLFDLPEAHSPEAAEPIHLDEGAVIFPGMALPQAPALLDATRSIVRQAPFRHLVTPGGHRMSVGMTACGDYGWTSDRSGYRYTRTQPDSAQPWPPMPDVFRALVLAATERAGFDRPPLQSGLINLYRHGTRLSLHQDRDEDAPDSPIVSVSLGVAATFLWGGLTREAPVRRFRLSHGDVVVWGGPSRFVFHGIAPLPRMTHPATGECRVNLTFRNVMSEANAALRER